MTKSITVKYHEKKVGTLALTKDKKIAFSYDEKWLEEGFSISPFSLPLNKGVFISEKGMYGVFADSLPDAWGKITCNDSCSITRGRL